MHKIIYKNQIIELKNKIMKIYKTRNNLMK